MSETIFNISIVDPRNKINAKNQLAVPVFPKQLWNNKQATIGKQHVRYQNMKIPHSSQNVLQKPMQPWNCPVHHREGDGLMELDQVYRRMTVRLAEYVKSSADNKIQFIPEHEQKPEKVSLTHLAKHFQGQV